MAKKGKNKMFTMILLLLIIGVIILAYMKLKGRKSEPLADQGDPSPTINLSYCRKTQNKNKPECRKFMGIDDAVIQTNDDQVAVAVSYSS